MIFDARTKKTILPARKSTCVSLKFAFRCTSPIFREIGETGGNLAITALSYLKNFLLSFQLNLFKTPISRQDWPMILKLFLCYLLLFLNSWINGTKGDPAIHQPITALTMSLQRLELEPERVQSNRALSAPHTCIDPITPFQEMKVGRLVKLAVCGPSMGRRKANN